MEALEAPLLFLLGMLAGAGMVGAFVAYWIRKERP
jgi:hypothetical protein